LGFGFRVRGSGFGFAISGSGFRVWRFGFRFFGFQVSGFFGFRVPDWVWFRGSGFGFGVRGSGFGVSDVGLVLGFEFRV